MNYLFVSFRRLKMLYNDLQAVFSSGVKALLLHLCEATENLGAQTLFLNFGLVSQPFFRQGVQRSSGVIIQFRQKAFETTVGHLSHRHGAIVDETRGQRHEEQQILLDQK